MKAFILANQPPFEITETDIGRAERAKRKKGLPTKKKAGEVAMADFLSSEDGLDQWIVTGDPVLVLTEDMRVARRIFLPEPNVHTLGTIGLLRGMERVGLIPSADDLIREMRHPSKPGRRPEDRRSMSEPDEGLDLPSSSGSTWLAEP